MTFSHAVPFSSQQLQTLASWGETRPFGLEVRIATDHEELDEVAEFFRLGQNNPVYWITAVSTGEIDILDAEGAVDVAAGLDHALQQVEQQEAALISVA